MKLYQCIIGTPVIEINNSLWKQTNLTYAEPKIGHIVGFAYNVEGDVDDFRASEWKVAEVIPVVKFAGEKEPRKIHHSNIRILEEND